MWGRTKRYVLPGSNEPKSRKPDRRPRPLKIATPLGTAEKNREKIIINILEYKNKFRI